MNEVYKKPETQEEPKIITLERSFEGGIKSEISYCPELGGTITSIKIKGKEILRRDPNDLKGEKKRGGIPIMFPNAGPLKKMLEDADEVLEQHGPVSKSDKWKSKTDENGNKLIEELEGERSASYPYEQYLLRIISEIEEDGSVLLTQEVQNNSDKEMPISMGFHPYFAVPKGEKNNVEIDFGGNEKVNSKIRENYKACLGGETIIIDRSELEDPEGNWDVKIKIPGNDTITLDVSKEYENIWIWSMKSEDEDEDDFICVEPVLRKPGGLTDNPEIVEPHENFTGTVRFGMVKE